MSGRVHIFGLRNSGQYFQFFFLQNIFNPLLLV